MIGGMIFGALKAAKSGAFMGAKVAYTATPQILRGGMWYGSRSVSSVLGSPRMILGLGLTAGAMSYGADAFGGPQDSNMSSAARSLYAQRQGGSSTGFAPGMGATTQFSNGPGRSRTLLQQSTEGLVQGLHQGRHR